MGSNSNSKSNSKAASKSHFDYHDHPHHAHKHEHEHEFTSGEGGSLFSSFGNPPSKGGLVYDSQGFCNNEENAITGKFLSPTRDSVFCSFLNSKDNVQYKITYVDGISSNSLDYGVMGTNDKISEYKLQAIDFNKDGLDDLVITAKVGSKYDNMVYMNQGNGNFVEAYKFDACTNSKYSSGKKTVGKFFDMSGVSFWCSYDNGKNEFYTINTNAIPLDATTINKGSTKLDSTLAYSNPSWCISGIKLTLDFNGDKYTDIMCIENGHQYLMLSGGNSNSFTPLLGKDGKAKLQVFDTLIRSYDYVVGDFDGNGKDDLIKVDEVGNNWLYLSNGISFVNTTESENGNYNILINGKFCNSNLLTHYYAGDFNVDGKKDLWCGIGYDVHSHSHSNSKGHDEIEEDDARDAKAEDDSDSKSNSHPHYHVHYHDYIMLSKVRDIDALPNVIASVKYKDYLLQVPSDLSAYKSTAHSTVKLYNNRKYEPMTFDTPMSLHLKFNHTMNSFHRDIKSSDLILEGSKVSHQQEYEQRKGLFGNAEILNSYQTEISDSSALHYDWFNPKTWLGTNILSKWSNIELKDNAKATLLPNQCVDSKLIAHYYEDVPVTYNATAYFTAKDEKGNEVKGSDLYRIAQKTFNHPVTLREDNTVTYNVNGAFKHNALFKVESLYHDCSEVPQVDPASTNPVVRASLTYRNFQLSPPTNLTMYNTSIISHSRFVNSKEYGEANLDMPLVLNLKFFNSMPAHHKDIKSSELIKEGEVKYVREYDNAAQLSNNNEILTGYKVDPVKQSQNIEFGWRTAQDVITSNILSQWDQASIEHTAKLSVLPNKCVSGSMVASIYKDIPVPYTSTAHFTATDENGYPVTGEKLKAIASATFVNNVTLRNNNEVIFTSEGVLKHNILHNVETSVRDCDTLSPLQVESKLPRVHVSLTYTDFNIAPDNVPQDYETITASKKVENKKKYGSVDYKVPLSLEVKLSESLESFHKDIKENDLVIDGQVHYIKKFDGAYYTLNKQLDGYKVSVDNTDSVSHPWHSSQSKVSSDKIFQWDKLKIENQIDTTLVPNQCVDLQMSAKLYKSVNLPYTAKGYFSAKTEDGYPVQGDKLLDIANKVFDKNAFIPNSQGEIEFETDGTITHSLVGDVQTQILDCQ